MLLHCLAARSAQCRGDSHSLRLGSVKQRWRHWPCGPIPTAAGTSHGRVLGWRIGARATAPHVQQCCQALQATNSDSCEYTGEVWFNAASAKGAAAGNAIASAANKANITMPTVCSLLAARHMQPHPVRSKTAETETGGIRMATMKAATADAAANQSTARESGAASLASSAKGAVRRSRHGRRADLHLVPADVQT